jgi:hypothetical protein
MRATTLGVIGLICVATTAQGQLVGLNELWTVAGVRNDPAGTVITCTNRNASSQTIGVDIYGPGGAYVNGGSITAAPNATVMFATDAFPNTPYDVDLAIGIFSKGHARIFGSTKSGIICSAYLMLASNGQPVADLTVAKKTKQKGD